MEVESAKDEQKLYLFYRSIRVINDDPQRRCYNGCHFSTKEEWSDWESLGRVE